jgi:hypothetical protein
VGAVKNSRLLGDFRDMKMREQRLIFAEKLDPQLWNDYIEPGQDDDPGGSWRRPTDSQNAMLVRATADREKQGAGQLLVLTTPQQP